MVEAQPDLFWGLIASMWVGNLMLLVINLPMIGMWVKLLAVPYRHMYPSIMIFCAIGVYSLQNNVFDVYQTVVFGIFGYLCSKLRLEAAPMLIGFVLGPMMEEHLRRAMLLSRGDPMVFLERPISATMLAHRRHRPGRDAAAQHPQGQGYGVAGRRVSASPAG